MLRLLVLLLGMVGSAAANPTAEEVFGGHQSASPGLSSAVGGYTYGCLAGGRMLEANGPGWQVMRLSRNRFWGHEQLIDVVKNLAAGIKDAGHAGILVGDLSQPRGGPMHKAHRSHQMGLDGDIWFKPAPKEVMSDKDRENVSAVSMLKDASLDTDPNLFGAREQLMLELAAKDERVERIFVHPGIKKAICAVHEGSKQGDWLGKIRPWYGHHYHFHIRLSCPGGNKLCKAQAPIPQGAGCGQELAWWMGPEPYAPKPDAKPKKKPRKPLLREYPESCQLIARD